LCERFDNNLFFEKDLEGFEKPQIKTNFHESERPELYFWRSKDGLESDLMVDRNSRLYPMEIQATATILPGHMDGITRWSKLTGDLKAGGILVADVVDLFSIKGYRGGPYPGDI